MHVTSTLNSHPWLKKTSKQAVQDGDQNSEKPLVGLALLWRQAQEVAQSNSHLTKIFKDRLNDFSLCKPDVINFLQELTSQIKKNHEKGSH